MSHKHFLWFLVSFGLYALVLILTSLFSYSFTDPNLVISTNETYWAWQQWMWRTWFDNPETQALTYGVLLTCQWLSFAFFSAMIWLQRKQLEKKPGMLVLCALVLMVPYLFSYNALSHDVFNYMFNARMVIGYQTNPHVTVALNFLGDPWLRFMHNTHTTAPYGYGWTAISLVPYLLGGGKFITTWLLFRLLALLSLLGTGSVVWHWLGQAGRPHHRWLLLALGVSPFVLSEVIMNAHNDLWMMLPAVGSIYLLDRWKDKGDWKTAVLAVILLAVSVSVKFVTVALLPVVVLMFVAKGSRLKKNSTFAKLALVLPLVCSVLLFLPLFHPRSQFFHAWYLLWPITWLPLISQKWWLFLLAGFAVSSTYRYLPWIAAGGFEGNVLLYQQLITWVGGIILGILLALVHGMLQKSVFVKP